MGVADHDVGDEILVPRRHARTALSAAPLRPVGIQRDPFDVATVADRDHHLLTRDQVFDVIVGFVVLNACAAVVAELFGHGPQFAPDQVHTQVAVGQDFEEFLDLGRQLFEFGGDLVPF